MRRRRELEARLHEAERLLDRIDRNVEGIERVTIVREPGSALAADAYDGLRRQVGAALAERNAHLHQLAQFDSARRADATPEQLESLVREWMGQARLEVVLDPQVPGAFEEVGDPHGAHLRVLTPAYVDANTGRVVRNGFVERMKGPASSATGGAGALDGVPGVNVVDEAPAPAAATSSDPNGASA